MATIRVLLPSAVLFSKRQAWIIPHFPNDPVILINLGVDAYRIPVELHQLLDDVRYWIKNETFSADDRQSFGMNTPKGSDPFGRNRV